MRGFLECQACFLRQALEAARYVTEDESVQALAISRVHEALAEIDYRLPPPLIARLVYGVVRDTTGVEDPYLAAKKESNELALGLYQWAQEKVADSASPLGVALKLAIAANVVDYGIGNRFDLRESLENVMTRSLDIDESARLFDELSQARVLLYLGDNSGEIVFDKLLLEKIGGRFPLLKKFFAVRGGPVINDITMDDADKVQMGDVAAVISTGYAAPGVVLDRSSTEFRELFQRADLVLAKGQGNYESLSGHGKKLFYLLKVKCEVVARDLEMPVGSLVLKENAGRTETKTRVG